MKHISQKKNWKTLFETNKSVTANKQIMMYSPRKLGNTFWEGDGRPVKSGFEEGGGACPYQQSVKEKQLKKSGDLNYFILRNRKLC